MDQPYIPSYMKLNYNEMSRQQLIDLIRWEALPVERFSTCLNKDDYIVALKKYVNEELEKQRIRKEGIIDNQKVLADQTEARMHHRTENRTAKQDILCKIKELKRKDEKTVEDYDVLCGLYEALFDLSVVPADRYNFS